MTKLAFLFAAFSMMFVATPSIYASPGQKDCSVVNGIFGDVDSRREALSLIGGSRAILMSENEIAPDALAELNALIEAPQGEETQAQLTKFLSKEFGNLSERLQDVSALDEILRMPKAPRFVVLDLGDETLKTVMDRAESQVMHMRAKVRFGSLKPELADQILLLALGPAIYLAYKDPTLMQNVKIVPDGRSRLGTLDAGEAPAIHADGNLVMIVKRTDLETMHGLILGLCAKASPNLNTQGRQMAPATSAPEVKTPEVPAAAIAEPTPSPAAPVATPVTTAPTAVGAAPIATAPVVEAKPKVTVATAPTPARRAPALRPIARVQPVRSTRSGGYSCQISRGGYGGMYKHVCYTYEGGRKSPPHWWYDRNPRNN